VTLSIISQLRLFYFRYLSKPVADRPIYRAIGRLKAKKIVELGIGDGRRALRMIEVARRASASSDVHYVGMDLFEGRTEANGQRLSLKAAHQLLRRAGVPVQLVPGNPADGLMRLANSLGKVDLLIVPAELESSAAARMWFFVPRMLHEWSLVFIEGRSAEGERLLRLKPRHEIDRLAATDLSRRAA
jgi:hypothetical protein